MDELVHHCLRELSFDGDLGCDVSRLRDFIVGFYTVDATHPQTVDDSLCGFVWSLIAQQPTVRVGTVPPGATEVYIAQQTSAKRKAQAKGEELVKAEDTPSLDVVEDASTRSLDDLSAEYGESLRIAVDPATSFAAITGSHLRPPKLSPMVYSALQLITRGREQGISVVDLGKKTRYDQKTCFYLVKQLMELDLVVKKKKSGVGTNFVIHKYFYERDLSWQQIRDEEAQAQAEADFSDDDQQGDDEPGETDASQKVTQSFDPIDARHMSSLPLVRSRVIKLLKASHNNLHTSQNMLTAIGFVNPTKSDRRFFQARLRELIAQGVVERVLVTTSRQRNNKASHVKCLKLVSPDVNEAMQSDDIVMDPPDLIPDGAGGGAEDMVADDSGLKVNLTIHKQISDLLEEAGLRGMTLHELSQSLCNFDKRTIELLLTRAEKNQPPPHLSDLGTAELMETFGRERRHRYYTVSAFRSLAAREGLDDSATGYANIDFSVIGGFAAIDPELFYNSEAALATYADKFKDKSNPITYRKQKKKDPILPDGTVKPGCSQKERLEGVTKRGGGKRKRTLYDKGPTDVASAKETPEKRPAGRPRKKPRLDADSPASKPHAEQLVAGARLKKLQPSDIPKEATGESTPVESATPKKRGRPKKKQPSDVQEEADDDDAGEAISLGEEGLLPKKRGRPPKQVADEPSPMHPTTLPNNGSAPLPPESSRPAKRNKPTPNQQVSSPIATQATNETAALVDFPSDVLDLVSLSGLEEAAVVEPQTEGIRRSARKRKPTARDGFESPVKKGKASLPPKHPRPVPFTSAVESQLPSPAPTRVASSKEVSLVPPRAPPASARPSPESQDEADISHVNDPAIPPTVNYPPVLSDAAPEIPGAGQVETHTDGGPQEKIVARPKVNVSHLRRENELYKLVENFGGMVNLQTKDFTDAHMTLIESMTQSGEPTSAPLGTRLDKRTAEATLTGMTSRGRVKMLKTSLISSLGIARPATIVYLPDIEEEKLNAFLADLGRTHNSSGPYVPTVKTIEEPLSFSSGRSQSSKSALPLQLLQGDGRGENGERWRKNNSGAAQLFAYDDATIREVLLTERETVGQLYGLIPGKVMRARELHLLATRFLENEDSYPRIVSKTQRIIDLSFFYHDISLSKYCSLIGVVHHDDELDRLLATPEGQQTPVARIPVTISNNLQVGRARMKTRFLDLLDLMRFLGLVTPLRAAVSDTPPYTIEPNGKYPPAFDLSPLEGWSPSVSSSAPIYWRFNERAPLYLWSQSETSPPYWQDVATRTSDEANKYWRLLDEACRDREFALSFAGVGLNTTRHVALEGGANAAKTLRRDASWIDSYKLSWHQEQYLHRFVNPSTGETPLEDGDTVETQLQNMCWVVSAPRAAVESFFMRAHKRITKQIDTSLQKKKRKKTDAELRQAVEARALLQRKAAEAKLQREKDWDNLLRRIHPEPLKGSTAVRMRRVRTRFMQSSTGGDIQKWEAEIAQTLREVNLATKEELIRKRPHFLNSLGNTPTTPLPVVSAHPEKSVSALIAQQGPAIVHQVKRKAKAKDGSADPSEVNKSTRKGRFQWNRDYDELARDAYVVIRARCRDGIRVEWGAYEQAFPAVPRNSVRQRTVILREVPGADAYLKRLEDRWYDIWVLHRGTDNLPDDDLQSASNFDIVKHIEFLRRHVDKNAIRVGFSLQVSNNVRLPSTVEDLDRDWQVLAKSTTEPAWDFMWNTQVEEGREKAFLRHAFTANCSELPVPPDVSTEANPLAESAVKMVFGAPNESYDPDRASRLLHSLGEATTSNATSNLLAQSVLSKSNRDARQLKPGRSLKISEMNQNALGGTLARDTFLDAVALDDVATEEEDWRPWPLLCNDGDTAALIQLVSEDKVEFEVDTSQAQAARPILDWNSKKTDDDQIETALSIRFRNLSHSAPELQSPEGSPGAINMELENECGLEHGLDHEGKTACCRKESDGLIDCQGCLESETSSFLAGLTQQENDLVQSILNAVHQAGAKGIEKENLLVAVDAPRDVVMSLVERMTETAVPLLFWVGYSCVALSSAAYLREWSVLIAEDPRVRIFPRRWLGLAGEKVPDVWDAALKAVVGLIVFRPGISQLEVRWRLRPVYDRQEVNDALHYLVQEGNIYRRSIQQAPSEMEDVMTLTEEEERNTFWFMSSSKHWYQI